MLLENLERNAISLYLIQFIPVFTTCPVSLSLPPALAFVSISRSITWEQVWGRRAFCCATRTIRSPRRSLRPSGSTSRSKTSTCKCIYRNTCEPYVLFCERCAAAAAHYNDEHKACGNVASSTSELFLSRKEHCVSCQGPPRYTKS